MKLPTAVFAAAWFVIGITIPAFAADLVLSEFNNSGFDWTFDDFTVEPGPTSARVYDTINGWGGAGVNRTLDLTSHADSRLVMDMFANSGNGVNRLDLELLDTSGNTGKWTLNVGGASPGTPQSLVTATTLSQPTHGVGDWQNLDLGQIRAWQILGDFGSPGPFDMSFDRLVISDSAPDPPPYAGYEPDAPWRAVAASQIESHRQADLQVEVTDAAGFHVPAAGVNVSMQKHEFDFGTAVQARRLDANDPTNATYQQKISTLFNYATIENGLKWPPWDGEWGPSFGQQTSTAAVNWLLSQGIDVRGHNLVWPGRSNLPQPVQDLLDQAPLNPAEQQTLRNLIESHIDDIAGTFAGQLDVWDVVNEPRANNDIMQALSEGDLAMVDWFQRAAIVDPGAKRYLNDYGILNSGGNVNTSNQQTHYDFVEYLINNGAPIDGIGFQGHFSPGDLTGPEQLWQIFDRFDALGLDMQITEFDFDTTDEALQAAYTRDILTAAFAHEGLDAFVFWGFYEDAHWRPDAALFHSDWSIKPNGEEFLDLVFNQWWTNESGITDMDGEAFFRAFRGDHEITASYHGYTGVLPITLSGSGEPFVVALPFLIGDLDENGDLDCDDVNALANAIASGNTNGVFDLNGDGSVDKADLDWWLQRAAVHDGLASSYWPGDANLDGVVDTSDFNLWNANKFSPNAGYCGGDFNADGVVDTSDFNIWNANKFRASVETVPETVPYPISICCLVLISTWRRSGWRLVRRAHPSKPNDEMTIDSDIASVSMNVGKQP